MLGSGPVAEAPRAIARGACRASTRIIIAELRATGVLSDAELSAIEYRTIAPLLPRFRF